MNTPPMPDFQAEEDFGELASGWMEDFHNLQQSETLQSVADVENLWSNPMSIGRGSNEGGLLSDASKTTHQQPLFEAISGSQNEAFGSQLPPDLICSSYECPPEYYASLGIRTTNCLANPFENETEHEEAYPEESAHLITGGDIVVHGPKDLEQIRSKADSIAEDSPSPVPPVKVSDVVLLLWPIAVSVPNLALPAPNCPLLVSSRKRKAEHPPVCPSNKTKRINAHGSRYQPMEKTTVAQVNSWDKNMKSRTRAFHSIELAKKLLEERDNAPDSSLTFLDNIYGIYWNAFLKKQVPFHSNFPAISTRSTTTDRLGGSVEEEDGLPSFRKQWRSSEGKFYPEVTWGMTEKDILRALRRQKEQGFRTNTGEVGSAEGRIRHMQSFMAHQAALRMLEYRHKMEPQAAAWADTHLGKYWELYLGCKPTPRQPNPQFQEKSVSTE